jgi:predicted DNA-binding transcriptional regulator AlpA
MEILTVETLAEMLSMSTNQVYEMTRARTRSGAMRDNPIPVLRVNGNVRFSRESIDLFLARCEQKNA